MTSDFWGAAQPTPPVPGAAPTPASAASPAAAGFTPVGAAESPAPEQPVIPTYWRPGMAVASVGPQYGAQFEALPDVGEEPRVRHRPWSTVLLVFHVLQLVAAVVLTGAGVVFMMADQGASGGMGGLAGMLGVVMLAVGAVLLVIALTLLLLTTKGRRRADEGRPGMLFVIGVIATVLGVLSLAGLLGGGEPVTWIINVMISGLYTFAGVRTLQAARG